MPDPVHLYTDSQISLKIWKACTITGVVCFLFGFALSFVATDQKFMNKPIIERTITKFDIDKYSQVYVTPDTSEWWVKDIEKIKPKVIKEKK